MTKEAKARRDWLAKEAERFAATRLQARLSISRRVLESYQSHIAHYEQKARDELNEINAIKREALAEGIELK